jgi:hypothetical protein
MRDTDGMTPFIYLVSRFVDLEIVKIMCEADESLVSEKYNDQFPLELLPPVYDENSCAGILSYLLNLYPAALSAQERDTIVDKLHHWAECLGESESTIRLLLNFESPKRRDLNFAARKEGMFLAFRALSSDANPSI